MNKESASVTADVLVTTDTWGIHTHGTGHLYNYIKKIRAGGMDPQGVPEVLSEGPGWSIMDGHSSIGIASSCLAMEIAIKKAASTGIGFVGVRNSNHFGAAGYYTNIAVKHDMIGLAMSNGNPNMTGPGARSSIIGNNPLSYAVPTGNGQSIFLDMATSNVASGKVMAAKALETPIPDSWIVDEEGIPTTDLKKYPTACSLQPMGAHKGYGLAIMIEIMAGVLTGANIINEVESWLLNLPAPTKMGHAFIAINIGAFSPIHQFKKRMDEVVQQLRNSPKAKGAERIYLPGEIEWEKRESALKKGLFLPEDVLASLCALAEVVELDFRELFS